MSRVESYLGSQIQTGNLRSLKHEVSATLSGKSVVEQLESIQDTEKRNKLAENIINLHSLSKIDRDFALEGFRGKYITFKHIINQAKLKKTVFRPKVVAHERYGHATVIKSKGGTVIEESFTGKGNSEGYVIAHADVSKRHDDQHEDIGAFAMGGKAIENFLGDNENHGCGHDMHLAHNVINALNRFSPGRTSEGRIYSMAYNSVKGNKSQIIQGSWELATPYLEEAA